MAHPISSVLGIGTNSMVGAGGGGGRAGNAKVEMVTERLDSADQPIAFLARTVKLYEVPGARFGTHHSSNWLVKMLCVIPPG
jgi:hypothetical protein